MLPQDTLLLTSFLVVLILPLNPGQVQGSALSSVDACPVRGPIGW